MPFITKQYQFCAAHRYWNSEWSEEENKDIFGKDIYIHGHNYLLDITIEGPIYEQSGFIINLKTLNELVKERVINIFDHSQIEKDISWFINRQPSTENMIIFIWNQIYDKIPLPSKLYKIKLQETPTIYTEYFGPHNDD
jgi:6-pyruvoyltetrahydropterin/6-carboxytetrahydropterin synthase